MVMEHTRIAPSMPEISKSTPYVTVKFLLGSKSSGSFDILSLALRFCSDGRRKMRGQYMAKSILTSKIYDFAYVGDTNYAMRIKQA